MSQGACHRVLKSGQSTDLARCSDRAKAAQALLEVFHRRFHHGATMVATNRPIEDWGKILSDNAAASAILDRLLEEAHLVKIPGRSYRLKQVVKEQKEGKNTGKSNTKSLK